LIQGAAKITKSLCPRSSVQKIEGHSLTWNYAAADLLLTCVLSSRASDSHRRSTSMQSAFSCSLYQ
jgi:hypothetical protein